MQAIEVKFLPATNYQSTRLKATSESISIMRDRDYAKDFQEQAMDLAFELANKKLNWSVKKFAVGCFKEKYYFVIIE